MPLRLLSLSAMLPRRRGDIRGAGAARWAVAVRTRRQAAALCAFVCGAVFALVGGQAGAAPVHAAVAAASLTCDPATAHIVTASGAIVDLTVEIADTPAEREHGLMGRRMLAPGAGMLFVYESPRQVSFWMKNTLIPLDMLFFDPAGVLRMVHAQAHPLDLTPIPGAAPDDPDPGRLLVLEIAGGEAARLGIRPGARLAHPAVPHAAAAAPCT